MSGSSPGTIYGRKMPEVMYLYTAYSIPQKNTLHAKFHELGYKKQKMERHIDYKLHMDFVIMPELKVYSVIDPSRLEYAKRNCERISGSEMRVITERKLPEPSRDPKDYCILTVQNRADMPVYQEELIKLGCKWAEDYYIGKETTPRYLGVKYLYICKKTKVIFFIDHPSVVGGAKKIQFADIYKIFS